jgi:hypothetical protein
MQNIRKFFLSLAFFAPFLFTCDFDPGLEPMRSGFQGTVTFKNQWPAGESEVYVAAATKWPPAEIADIALSEPLPTQVTTAHYELYTTPMSFTRIGVIWKKKGQPWNLSDLKILGYYYIHSNADSSYGNLTIKDNKTMLKNINIKANLAITLPTASGFSGTITFINAWPANTDQVILAASTKFPPQDISEIILSDPLPTFVDKADYSLNVPPGTYKAVGIIWKEKDQDWNVTNIVGIYFPTSDQFSPGVVEIKDRTTWLENIDITADLSKARRKVESSISGTLRVTGAWPANAQSVIIGASPTLLPTSLLEITLSQPIAPPFDTTTYTLQVQPGTYRLIGALVIMEGESIGMQSIKGVYYNKPTDILPGSVEVADDKTKVENVDINIEF